MDGVIEGRGGGAGQPGVLVTEREDFTNYRLRVEFQCLTPGGGAGIELAPVIRGRKRGELLLGFRGGPSEPRR